MSDFLFSVPKFNMSKMGDLKTSFLIEPFMEGQDEEQALPFSAFQNANAPGPKHFFLN